MNIDSAHTSGWRIAEVIFGLPFLGGILLNVAVPLPLAQGPIGQAILPVGIVLIVVGIGCVVSARRAFAHHGQPTDPGRPTGRIVSAGIFSVSRNPIYLGCALADSGLAMTVNIPWLLIAFLLSIVLCHYILILPEEKYLAARFGGDYHEYRSAVRRWLGRT